jgi:hypothetical protein
MSERLCIWIAWILPRKVAYWAAIRVGTHATVGRYSSQIVPDLNFMKALKRWD